MPTALLRRVNLDYLYSPFLEKVLDMLADCQAEGRQYWATLGFRSFADQDALYNKGRLLPGPVVTEARGGDSAHNYGIALDFCAQRLDIPAESVSIPDWSPDAYEILGRNAKLRGLLWGGTWTVLVDRPHVQWPGYVTPAELESLRLAFAVPPPPVASDAGSVQSSLRRAWAVLDRA